MTKAIDMTGFKNGRLTVIAFSGHVSGRRAWLCRCECGTEKILPQPNISKTFSCGCYRDERIRAVCGTLAHRHRAEYKTWCGIKRRCLNKNDQSYRTYGATGVVICDRWKNSFEAFFADMGEKPSPKHTIDRLENSRGYEPGNCRWATRRQQAQNTRKATTLTYKGITKPTPEWAREFGIRLQTLHHRLLLGWNVHLALTTPLRKSDSS